MSKGITLDNASTTGELLIRGPATGVANFNIPATDGLVVDSLMQFDSTTGEFIMVAVPAPVDVPTKVSELTNDSGFQTAANVASAIAGKADTSSLAAVATSGAYADLSGKPTLVSAFTNDAGYQTASDVTTAIAGKADTSSLATVATSGSYADLSNKPTIPTVPTVVSAFTNDSGYLTSVPVATNSVLGGVKTGDGISIAVDGTISVSGVLVDPVVSTNTQTQSLGSVDTTDDTDTLALAVALTDSSALMFTADVVVTNGNGTSAGGYTLQGVVRRGTGAASTTLIGGALKSVVAEDVGTWDAYAVANTTTGAIEIRVKGAVSNSLSWFVASRVTHIN